MSTRKRFLGESRIEIEISQRMLLPVEYRYYSSLCRRCEPGTFTKKKSSRLKFRKGKKKGRVMDYLVGIEVLFL